MLVEVSVASHCLSAVSAVNALHFNNWYHIPRFLCLPWWVIVVRGVWSSKTTVLTKLYLLFCLNLLEVLRLGSVVFNRDFKSEMWVRVLVGFLFNFTYCACAFWGFVGMCWCFEVFDP